MVLINPPEAIASQLPLRCWMGGGSPNTGPYAHHMDGDCCICSAWTYGQENLLTTCFADHKIHLHCLLPELPGRLYSRVEFLPNDVAQHLDASILREKGGKTFLWKEAEAIAWMTTEDIGEVAAVENSEVKKGDSFFAIGAARQELNKALGTKLEPPVWMTAALEFGERIPLRGALDGDALTPIAAARLEAALLPCAPMILDPRFSNYRCAARHVASIIIHDRLAGAEDEGHFHVKPDPEAERKAKEALESLVARQMNLKARELRLLSVLQMVLKSDLQVLQVEPPEMVQVLANLGQGRFVRVLVVGGREAARPIIVVRDNQIAHLDGGDVEIWLEFSRDPNLAPSTRREATFEQHYDDDDDDDPEGNPFADVGGNYPSGTGNPSGGGRGND